MTIVYRCKCGHFEEEHGGDGCAGCDNGGQTLDVIAHEYDPDPERPEVLDEEEHVIS